MRAFWVVLLLLPSVVAQSHDHEAAGPVSLVTDLGADGIALAGTPAHFAAIAFGTDDEPDFHQDLPLRVLLDGQVLWETTASSGHDYDGVQALDVTFPHAGDWRVEALDGSGAVVAHREGVVLERITETEVRFVGGVLQEGTVRAGVPYQFRYGLEGAHGLLNHTDVSFEVYKDGLLVFRTHTHTHTELQEVTLTFPEPGSYVVRRVGYQAFPTQTGSAFQPVVAQQALEVLAPAVAPLAQVPAAPTDLNVVARGDAADPYVLLGTYDPYTVVGPGTLQHLSALVVDPETRQTVQHVDFSARLEGPMGVLFESETLHEYDGIFELATQQTVPGVYRLVVVASRGDWTGSVTLPYTVAPPAAATVAGPQVLSLDAPTLATGAAADFVLSAADPAGRPFAHGELELDLRDADGLPLLHTKLHTHDDGTFAATLALARNGTHPLSVTPFPLMPQPVATYHRDEVGQALRFALEAEGEPWTTLPGYLMDDDVPLDADVPAPGAVLVLALLAVAAVLRRR